jgi:HEAT repeat protein
MTRKKNTILIMLLAALLAGPAGLYAPAAMRLSAAEKASPREITGLINRILDETDEAKRQEQMKKLRAYPADDVIPCWVDQLKGAIRVSTTVHVIDLMAEFGDKRLVMPLANRLVSPHYAIRKSAARALKKFGDDRLYPVILKMVNSDVPVHRIYFIEAMNYLYDQRFYLSMTGLMREDNKSIRIYVINCFKENRVTESLGLIRGAAMSDKNDEVRIAAIDAIGAMRDGNGLNVLHVTLNDKNRDVRCESAKSIGLIDSIASVNPLCIRLMSEEDNEIKEIMIETLASLKRAGDVRGLERIMLNDGNLSLRIKAAYILGFSGSQQAFSVLVQALKDQDYRVRGEVCNSLGYYRNRQSLASLYDVMEREKELYVKSAALYSVKRINDKTSLMELFDLFTKETDPIFSELLRDAIREYIKRYI